MRERAAAGTLSSGSADRSDRAHDPTFRNTSRQDEARGYAKAKSQSAGSVGCADRSRTLPRRNVSSACAGRATATTPARPATRNLRGHAQRTCRTGITPAPPTSTSSPSTPTCAPRRSLVRRANQHLATDRAAIPPCAAAGDLRDRGARLDLGQFGSSVPTRNAAYPARRGQGGSRPPLASGRTAAAACRSGGVDRLCRSGARGGHLDRAPRVASEQRDPAVIAASRDDPAEQ